MKEKLDVKKLNEIILLGGNVFKILFFLLIIIGLYAITLVLKEWQVFEFVLLILGILSPLFIGLIIAWLLEPVVKYLIERGVSRILSTGLSYLMLIVILYLAITGIFPVLLNQLNEFISLLPPLFDDLTTFVNSTIDRFKDNPYIDAEGIKDNVVTSINTFVATLTTDVPAMIVSFISSLFATVGLFAVGLIVGFYLLFDFDNVAKNFISLVPHKYRKDTKNLLKELNVSLFNYLKGTLFVSILIFALSSLLFTIIGLKAPLLFGLICGITNFIPYVGPLIGAVPVLLAALTQGLSTVITALIAITIIQFVEGNFIQPLVMSRTMKLHPVTVMVGLLICGYFFGIIGMIIATPLVAAIKILYVFFDNKYHFLNYRNEEK